MLIIVYLLPGSPVVIGSAIISSISAVIIATVVPVLAVIPVVGPAQSGDLLDSNEQ